MATYLGKSKRNVFGSAVIASLLISMCTPNFIMTWSNCCKRFCWFYLVDKVGTLFCWFVFFIAHILFPAFICVNNTRRLVNSFVGVKIWIPSFTLLTVLTSIGGKSSISSFLSLSCVLLDSSFYHFLVFYQILFFLSPCFIISFFFCKKYIIIFKF